MMADDRLPYSGTGITATPKDDDDEVGAMEGTSSACGSAIGRTSERSYRTTLVSIYPDPKAAPISFSIVSERVTPSRNDRSSRSAIASSDSVIAIFSFGIPPCPRIEYITLGMTSQVG